MAQEREVDGRGGPEVAEQAIVAFDFDGTMTVRDSYTAFLKFRTPPLKWAMGGIRLIPAAIAYLFDRNRERIKIAATRVYLRGVTREALEGDAKRFAEACSRTLLRPDAVAAWKNWRRDRVKLIIVTASPDVVVAPFARGLGADDLLGTPLAYDSEGRVTGLFLSPNCRGAEKVVRLKAAYGPGLRIKAAYGDSDGDTEMLAIAEQPYFRVFKGRP